MFVCLLLGTRYYISFGYSTHCSYSTLELPLSRTRCLHIIHPPTQAFLMCLAGRGYPVDEKGKKRNEDDGDSDDDFSVSSASSSTHASQDLSDDEKSLAPDEVWVDYAGGFCPPPPPL